MQKLILFVTLFNALTSYSLFSMLNSINLYIGSKYYSQNKQNYISIAKVGEMIYSPENQIIAMQIAYNYPKNKGQEELGFVGAEVSIN
jgi:hypothetical protein